MNFQDEILKVIIGLIITGIISLLYKLFWWVDKTDARLHDIDRDMEHLRRQILGLSQTVANLDGRADRMTEGFRRAIYSISGRITRVEIRVHVIEVKIGTGLTQAIAKYQSENLSESN